MQNIFNYLDYRKFLKDYYLEKKSENKAFSYQFFANKAGIKTKSLIHHIMDGKRKITRDIAFKLGQAMELNEKSFSYWEELIAFNHATTNREKNHYFKRLASYNKRSNAKLLLKEQYEYFSKWYYNTIRELIPFVDFHNDFKRLAHMLKPAITPTQARQAITALLKLGMIQKTANGYRQTDQAVTSGDEVHSLAIENFHLKSRDLAAKSIDTIPGNERDISCLVVGLSEKTFSDIKKEIQAFRKKIITLADSTENPSRVYHINFDMFPTSEMQEK
ncbi:MAG: TIGR02147 family protein [Fibrobacteria bacterium]|nr:TIGR02147 family protein [Fibrobacteria bacterium]